LPFQKNPESKKTGRNSAGTSGQQTAFRTTKSIMFGVRRINWNFLSAGDTQKLSLRRIFCGFAPGQKLHKEEKQKVLDNWYRRLIRDAVPGLMQKWEPRIGVTVKKVFLRKMKSHWGSCNYQNQTIRLHRIGKKTS
jgi:predicted metal-dependent hydrolase